MRGTGARSWQSLIGGLVARKSVPCVRQFGLEASCVGHVIRHRVPVTWRGHSLSACHGICEDTSSDLSLMRIEHQTVGMLRSAPYNTAERRQPCPLSPPPIFVEKDWPPFNTHDKA